MKALFISARYGRLNLCSALHMFGTLLLVVRHRGLMNKKEVAIHNYNCILCLDASVAKVEELSGLKALLN